MQVVDFAVCEKYCRLEAGEVPASEGEIEEPQENNEEKNENAVAEVEANEEITKEKNDEANVVRR